MRDSAIDYLILAYAPSSGQLLGRYSAYEKNALGVRCISWAPNANWLAVGSFDGMARVLSAVTWRPVVECEHPSSVSSKITKLIDLSETCELNSDSTHSSLLTTMTTVAALSGSRNDTVENDSRGNAGHNEAGGDEEDRDAQQQQVTNKKPASSVHKFRLAKSDPKRDLPRIGVMDIQWSFDGAFFATLDDEKPTVLWIWKPSQFDAFAVIDFPNRITAFKWSPCHHRIAVSVSGQDHCFLWQPVGDNNSEVSISKTIALDAANAAPPKQPISSLRWHPGGDLLLLVGKQACSFAAC